MKLFAHRRRQVRRRTLLDHFLVPPLQRAVPVSDDEHVAADRRQRPAPRRVAGPRSAFSRYRSSSPKLVAAEAPDAVERRFQFGRAVRAPHADTAAASGALQHHWIADALGRKQRLPPRWAAARFRARDCTPACAPRSRALRVSDRSAGCAPAEARRKPRPARRDARRTPRSRSGIRTPDAPPRHPCGR